jgi:hypothetical protein
MVAVEGDPLNLTIDYYHVLDVKKQTLLRALNADRGQARFKPRDKGVS